MRHPTSGPAIQWAVSEIKFSVVRRVGISACVRRRSWRPLIGRAQQMLLLAWAVPLALGQAADRSAVRGAGATGVATPAEHGNNNLPLLTTVRQIRQLSPEEAARRYPVRLRGVVTYRARGYPFQFLQDETGGTYLSGPNPETDAVQFIGPGSIVEVEGVTTPGRFVPSLTKGDKPWLEWRVLGHGPLPSPRRVAISDLADPRFHSDYLELSGVVHSVRTLHVDDQEVVAIKIGSTTSAVTAQFFDRSALERLPPGLVSAAVTVRGVYGSMFNERRQLIGFRLFVDPDRGIQIDRPGLDDPLAQLPVSPLTAIMQFRGHAGDQPMMRVQGTVTHVVAGGGLYVESDGSALWIEADSDLPVLRPGDKVSAAGFPGLGTWHPILRDAIVRRIGHESLPPAPFISAATALTGSYDGRRVALEATVLDVTQLGRTTNIVLQGDGAVFVAEVVAAADGVQSMEIAAGSLVRVIGICVNRRADGGFVASHQPPAALPHPPRSDFKLLVGVAADVAILRMPSWWTPDRIWMALGVVLAAAAAVLGWNVVLRRRVAAQTEIIRAKTAREAVHEDRTRIARELHDTLEQELTGIAVQLDAVHDQLPVSPPAAAAALNSARGLLRHTRSEARRSVWDLRATLLEDGDLASALRETARHLQGETRIVVEVSGAARRLAAAVESNLLRIATEAMTNAVKHAAAREIAVKLQFEPHGVCLEVADDGCGFDGGKATTLSSGHFGLLGIRERIQRIGGTLEIASGAGRGTRIRACVTKTALTHSEGVPSRSGMRMKPAN